MVTGSKSINLHEPKKFSVLRRFSISFLSLDETSAQRKNKRSLSGVEQLRINDITVTPSPINPKRFTQKAIFIFFKCSLNHLQHFGTYNHLLVILTQFTLCSSDFEISISFIFI